MFNGRIPTLQWMVVSLVLMGLMLPQSALAETIATASDSPWAMSLPAKATAQDLMGQTLQQMAQPLPVFHSRMLEQLRLQAEVDQTRQLPQQLVPVWSQLSQPAKILF